MPHRDRNSCLTYRVWKTIFTWFQSFFLTCRFESECFTRLLIELVPVSMPYRLSRRLSRGGNDRIQMPLSAPSHHHYLPFAQCSNI